MKTLRIFAIAAAVAVSGSLSAVNLEDYMADGIGSWSYRGKFNGANAVMSVTTSPESGVWKTTTRIQTASEHGEDEDDFQWSRIEKKSYQDGFWSLAGLIGEDYGSFSFSKPLKMMPLNADSGEWKTSFKIENSNQRVRVDYSMRAIGSAEIEVQGVWREAFIIEQSFLTKRHDPVVRPEANWRYPLLETIDETWSYWLVEGYGPVRIQVLRTVIPSDGGVKSYDGDFRLDSANGIMESVIFTGAREITDDVWYSGWFGLFNTTNYPVIEHDILGETQVEGTVDDFWVELPKGLGWGNSSLRLYPQMWVTGLKNFYTLDTANSTPEMLYFRDISGLYVAAEVKDGALVELSDKLPTEPSITIYSPLSGRVDFDSSRRIMFSARAKNIQPNQIKQIYFVLGSSAGDPIVSSGLTGMEVHAVYVVSELQRNTEIEISAVLVDVAGNEYVSKPVRLALADTSFLPPQWEVDPISANTRTGDLLNIELKVNRPSKFEVISGALPEGIEIVPNPNGMTAFLTGIATETGIFRSMIRASNSAGAADLACMIYVGGGNKPRVFSPSTAYGRVGQGFSYLFRVTDATSYGELEFVLSDASLPDGLTFDSANALIQGIPTAFGEWHTTVLVKNDYGSTPFELTIVIAP